MTMIMEEGTRMTETPAPSHWTADVPERTDLIRAGYYTLEQACEYIGLSTVTVGDLLSRPRITAAHNMLAPISRPAARIGGEPVYTRRQLDDVIARRAVTRRLRSSDLDKLSHEEAERQHLKSYTEMAELFGFHENTLRKWGSAHDDFPAPVASREHPGGYPGTPTVVFDAVEVLRWLTDHDKVHPDLYTVRGREVLVP
jgi:hypothetical protein